MSAKPAAKPARITTAGKTMTPRRVAVRLRVGPGQRYRAGLEIERAAVDTLH